MNISDSDILNNYGAYGVGTSVLALAAKAEESLTYAYAAIKDITAFN